MPFVGFRRIDDNIDATKLENPFKQLPNQTEYFLLMASYLMMIFVRI